MGSFGGDSLTEDLNANFELANMVWIGTAAVLVWIMIPGIGLFYAGLSRKKHAMSLIFSSLAIAGVGSFQWFFWGYSLTFSHEAGRFLGKLDNFAMMKVLGAPSAASAVPDVLFMVYQGMFATATATLMMGGAHERARLGPMMLFIFVWMTIVYCPIAEWTWNPEGWLVWLGALDFAGGGPVHMASGAGALAYALVCGKRKDPSLTTKLPVYKPGSVLLCVLGTCFLWFGWFGFNGGSAGNATIRAWYAMANTNIAAAVGAMVWLGLDYFRKRKWSTIALCCGAIAGLVGITPCAGLIPLYCAIAVGAVTAAVCNFAIDLKFVLHIDDGLDVFALHGVGGATGSILTALFTADYISHLDGATVAQGWMNHHYVQLAYQLAAIGATIGWSFVVTFLILIIMKYIPFLNLRMKEEDELMGDQAQLAEYEMFIEEDLLMSVGVFEGQPPSVESDAQKADVVSTPSPV